MKMEDPEKDDMGSLFEGMVLFNPSQMITDDVKSVIVSSDPTSAAKDEEFEEKKSIASSTLQPLDENLFSDLTVITPLVESGMETNQPSSTTTSAPVPERETLAYLLRLPSRKKKRAGLRIGYGRDPQQLNDHLTVSTSNDSSHVARKSSSSRTDLEAGGEGEEDSGHASFSELASLDSQSKQVASGLPPPITELTHKCVEKDEESSFYETNQDTNLNSTQYDKSPSVAAAEKESMKKTDATLVNSESRERTRDQEQKEDSGDKEEVTESAGTYEQKYDLIKEQVSERLRHAREMASSISSKRKDSRSRRRKAYLDVDQAVKRYSEIEVQLEEACEAEDFEAADRLSGMLAAANEEKAKLLSVLREAEADCDNIDSKMQEALDFQIASEGECISLLQEFAVDAASNAEQILESVEVNSLKEMEEWFAAVEFVEVKKLELEVKSHIVNEAQSVVSTSIDEIVEKDKREKALLLDKKTVLVEELENLLRLVREKEAEIAENDSMIEEVDKRINEAVSGFEGMQSGIVSKLKELQSDISEMESEFESLSHKKEEIDNFLSLEKERGTNIRELAKVCQDEASKYQENAELRRSLRLLAMELRDEKVRLATNEEKILDDVQQFKQEVAATRASLQELSSRKSIIQQEIASFKQRVYYIDKRLPELESEKKVAASTRNFKEAARVAAESKTLSNEKETQQTKVNESALELEKIEEEIKGLTRKIGENESLVTSKEREVALTQFQRFRLVAAAAIAEREAALELGDEEEANVFLGEAEAADSAAKQLKTLHEIGEDEVQGMRQKFVSLELACALDGEQLAQLVGQLSNCSSS